MGKNNILNVTYLLGFIFSLHAFLPIYVNAPFLSTFTTERTISLIYALASLIGVLGFLAIPNILRRLGNYTAVLTFVFLELIAILGLVYSTNVYTAGIFLMLHIPLTRMIWFNIDVFIESVSVDSETGSIRGKLLTFANIALIISPIVTGWLLIDNEYWKIYILSAILLVPLAFLILLKFKNFKDPVYDQVPIISTFREIRTRKDIFNILRANFILRIFFAVMVIYTPIYLLEHIGFNWQEIGVLFTIMLLPYVLLEFPLGKMADKWFGEKEMLTIGFFITAIATMLISFTTNANFILWALILAATRVGASFIESMTEVYFFKKIDATDSHILGFYRLVQPLGYIIAPIIGSIALLFIDLRYAFLLFGIIVLWGLRYSLDITDTK
jgi:MFS family permease